ncbi:uncharacterized protein LOC125965448 [Orcinus orca]|uniref:uncharacterized protein LOC125965448 n=1 Tax=Orcinus orca TaxID=9733 RepID=UPI0021112CA0|nr:uncharacterized protein LOC125965448 [Orcinus orca]
MQTPGHQPPAAAPGIPPSAGSPPPAGSPPRAVPSGPRSHPPPAPGSRRPPHAPGPSPPARAGSPSPAPGSPPRHCSTHQDGSSAQAAFPVCSLKIPLLFEGKPLPPPLGSAAGSWRARRVRFAAAARGAPVWSTKNRIQSRWDTCITCGCDLATLNVLVCMLACERPCEDSCASMAVYLCTRCG